MKFEVIGTVTIHVRRVFEDKSLKSAEDQVNAWKTWNAESILDMMDTMSVSTEIDSPEIIRAPRRRKNSK